MSYDDERLVADLKALLRARKRSARSVSIAIDVPYRSMQNYLSGESRMPAIVLIKILDEIGADLRRLRYNDNLLRHADLFDALHKVFGDFLSEIPINSIGQRSLQVNPRLQTPEMMATHLARNAVAGELAVRLSEAYDELVGHQLTGGHMPTIKELREMDQRRGELNAEAGDEVGQ